MRNHFDLDPEGAREYGTARAIVASLCVLGLASLMWFHGGASTTADDNLMAVPAAVGDNASLHAPTTDPSLPSLEATFARKDDAAADPAPAPTF